MLITDAAVRETADIVAQQLGGNWALDGSTSTDGAAHLIDGEGRAICFRPVFGGTAVQLWITGNAAPRLPRKATQAERSAHEAELAARLPEGHRYNKAATLVTDDDEEPAVVILRTLENHLLPAFQYKPHYVGHQPWNELFADALAAVTADNPSPTPANGGEAEAAPSEPGTIEVALDPEPAPSPEPESSGEPDLPTSGPDVAIDPQFHATQPAPASEPAESNTPASAASDPKEPHPEVPGEEEEPVQATESPGKATPRRSRKRTTKRPPSASAP
ncbi:hypothetical protein [Streptomyces sp. NPDC088789]|uniref:hypothetical protein n=1 Tax=Streptomyces sp. NPDC088789 TaxID=3365899 RepID=UPI0038279553